MIFNPSSVLHQELKASYDNKGNSIRQFISRDPPLSLDIPTWPGPIFSHLSRDGARPLQKINRFHPIPHCRSRLWYEMQTSFKVFRKHRESSLVY
ncbi:hypothetical protein AVEN_173080-1 [Araneus ventricosus]|uniref:Uncharacterized protein n=1 Tax=Araneus ventricosus TaxID=182803 RepID=A0A4Y2HE92_ARAVE|nr:hypothetical protein AVEN_173080-1 [Araneus ventricosus]